MPTTLVPQPTLVKPATDAAPIKTLPTSPATSVKDSDLVSPASKQPAAASAPVSEPSKKTLPQLILEHFVRIEDLSKTGSFYPWRGVCAKCGWQTLQHVKADAEQLVFNHAQQHWRDVSRFL